MLLFSPNPADMANMGLNPSQGFFVICSISGTNPLHVGRPHEKHTGQTGLNPSAGVPCISSLLRPVREYASRTKTQKEHCWGSSAEVGIISSEGLFHYSDIPRKYTASKAKRLSSVRVSLTGMSKVANSPLQSHSNGTRNPAII